MPNYKSRHVYSMLHKHLGTPASSLAVIPNNGVTKLTLAATYALAAPEIGSLVTIYAVGVDATVVSTSSLGQVAFNAAGGAQKLNFAFNSTVSNQDISVTLLGEATTQWRILSAWPGQGLTTLEGISVTT
jgi:hypothetical protein